MFVVNRADGSMYFGVCGQCRKRATMAPEDVREMTQGALEQQKMASPNVVRGPGGG